MPSETPNDESTFAIKATRETPEDASASEAQRATDGLQAPVKNDAGSAEGPAEAPLFTAEYDTDLALLSSYVDLLVGEKQRKFALGMALADFVLAVICVFAIPDVWPIAIVFACIGISMLWYRANAARLSATKTLQKLDQADLHRVIDVYAEHVVLTKSDGTTHDFPLAELTEVPHNENLIVLAFGHSGVTIPSESLAAGTYEELVAWAEGRVSTERGAGEGTEAAGAAEQEANDEAAVQGANEPEAAGATEQKAKKALLIIDVQNDFCPGGALAVAQGDEVVPVINGLVAEFARAGAPVVATKDWHPAGHVSFASAHDGRAVGELVTLEGGTAQMLWPDHCVQGTPGAELHANLDAAAVSHVVLKGCDPGVDSYSAFFDNDRANSTDLDGWLRAQGVDELVVCGLACDYCVKYSVLDALSLGYSVTVPRAGTRAVEAQPGDGERALEEMAAAGATITE